MELENRASESCKSLGSDHRKHPATGTQERSEVPRGQLLEADKEGEGEAVRWKSQAKRRE